MSAPSQSHSAIYAGTVRHRRRREFDHAFSYPVNLVLLDLDELPGLLGGRLTRRRPGTWRFRRRDYLGPVSRPLADAARDRVAADTGHRPAGPVRLLTQLRCFGVAFNPVSLYYCHGADGTTVEAVLAEVTNTPWGERHAYVLGPFTGRRVMSSELAKAHHVSPFLPMDQRYTIRLTAPGPTLSVHIAVTDAGTGSADFDATLALRRTPLTGPGLAALIRRDPGGPLRTLRRIYTQGIALKLHGVTTFPHPSPAPAGSRSPSAPMTLRSAP